jgi:hypothetical protein
VHGRATFPAQPKVLDSAMSRSTAPHLLHRARRSFHCQGNGKACCRPEGYHSPDSFGKHSYPMQACEMQISSYGTEPPRAEPIEAESGVVLVIGADLSMIGKTTCGTSLKGNVILRNYRELCSAFSFSSRRSCVSFPVAGLHPKNHLSLRSPLLELEG